MLLSPSCSRVHREAPRIRNALPRAVAPSNFVEATLESHRIASEMATDFRADRALRAVWHFFGGEV
jgi:hypothetical protein